MQSTANPSEMGLSIVEELWFGDFPDEQAEKEAANSLVAMSAKVLGLRPFPEAVHKVLKMSRDPNCDMNALSQQIEADPSFASRALRLINSAALATRVRCTSIPQAVRLLGTRAIGEMATALAALQMFDTNSAQGVALKDHATAVAAVGRHLASKLGLPVDDVYTCGLLHDIGKLFLLQDSWSNYEGLCDGKDPDCAHDHERERYGYDHAVLAGHILKNWQIPDPVPTVVAWHHQFARAVNEGGPKARLVALVRLADAIIYALDGDAEVEVPKLAQMQEAEYLELSESQLSEWWLELHTVADENREKKTAQEQPQALPPVPEVTGEKDAKSFEKTAGPNKKTAWLGLGLAIGGIAAIIGVVALLFR